MGALQLIMLLFPPQATSVQELTPTLDEEQDTIDRLDARLVSSFANESRHYEALPEVLQTRSSKDML